MTKASKIDCSNGWEAIAKDFISVARWEIGAATVRDWSKFLTPGQEILDVGCGFGGSYTQDLLNKDISVFGIDASRSLIQEHQNRFPQARARCEAAETSYFFDRKFDAVLSIGLVFLLSRENQILVLQNMATALKPGGRMLFTSPYQICHWDDLLTGRKSFSLGRECYTTVLQKRCMQLLHEYTDEGENHYFDFGKSRT